MGGPWAPVTPDWVAPDASQISDLHWLAYAMLVQTRLPWAAGVGATIAWIRGGRIGPITGRDEQPVTRAIADAERWAAEAARDPEHTPPMGAVYAQLEVAPWSPLPDRDPNYAVGCWRALRWVLGVPGQEPPLQIPRRHPDGRVVTAADIYREQTRGDDVHLGPERRTEIRVAADYWASQYVHAAAQILDIQRKLAKAG